MGRKGDCFLFGNVSQLLFTTFLPSCHVAIQIYSRGSLCDDLSIIVVGVHIPNYNYELILYTYRE